MTGSTVIEFAAKHGVCYDGDTKLGIGDLMGILPEKVHFIFVFGQEEVEQLASGMPINDSAHDMFWLGSILQTNLL